MERLYHCLLTLLLDTGSRPLSTFYPLQLHKMSPSMAHLYNDKPFLNTLVTSQVL
jgi:hypothetical protein